MSQAPTDIWIGRGNDQLGPHPIDKLRQLHAEGALRADDLVWWDGLPEWTPRDAALTLLGIVVAPAPALARAAPPPMPTAPTVSSTAGSVPTPERRRALVAMFGGLLTFAVLAAAAFTFLRTPKLSLPSFAGRSDMVEVLNGVAMYKTAYAEYAMSTDQVPQSLADIGMSSAPFGAMIGVRIEAGTILADTTRGVLALQPYRNANYQVWFRCGHAAPPAGMTALGTIDSAGATTVPDSDLPDDCR